MLALNQALTAEQRLSKAVMSVMAHDKYVGSGECADGGRADGE